MRYSTFNVFVYNQTPGEQTVKESQRADPVQERRRSGKKDRPRLTESQKLVIAEERVCLSMLQSSVQNTEYRDHSLPVHSHPIV